MKRTEAYVAEALALARACTSDQQVIADGSMFGGKVAGEVLAWEAENSQRGGDHRLGLERALAEARDGAAAHTRAREFLDAALSVMVVEWRSK